MGGSTIFQFSQPGKSTRCRCSLLMIFTCVALQVHNLSFGHNLLSASSHILGGDCHPDKPNHHPAAEEGWQRGAPRSSSSSSMSSRALLYVHLHKSGGTEICELMKRERVNMTDMMGNPRGRAGRPVNCNTEISGPNNNVGQYATLQTCRMLEAYTMNEEGIPFTRQNFVSVEVPFQQAMPCPGFRSFATMREPMSRVISHMHAHKWPVTKIQKWISTRLPSPENYYMHGYPIINNFVIRMLLGSKRYTDTTTPITLDDLEQAKRRVDAFDAFIPLEYQQHPNVLKVLQEKIPEYHKGLVKYAKPRDPTKLQKNRTEFENSEFMEQLTKENAYDSMLYNYVLEKYGISPTAV